MNAALFLTAEPEAAAALLAAWRARLPHARLTVFVRDDLRAPLAPALAGCEVRRDKAVGSRLAMLRALRRERFDQLVVAWQGGERSEPLKLAALFVGARTAVAVDERLREIPLRWWWPWPMLPHAARRLAGMQPLTVLRGACALYRATIGCLLGSIVLACAWTAARAGRRR